MNCDIPHPNTIIHIDIDCFYAQVEMVLNPSLADKPIGIKQKNLLVTSNYKAREMGLKKCMYVKDALKDLPSLLVIDGSDLTNYRKFSSDIFEILHSYTNLVEKLGFDEHFIDVSNIIEENTQNEITSKVFGIENVSFVNDYCGCGCFDRIKAGAVLARKIRASILETTGLECCAGISYNKLLAKIVCSRNKPNDQTIAFPWQVNDIMNSLKTAGDIPGIGRITFRGLNMFGIFSVKDLRNASFKLLSPHFGKKTTESFFRLVNGDDPSSVRPSGPPSTFGVEESFTKVTSVIEVKEIFLKLTNRLISLLHTDTRRPASFKITVRKVNNLNKYHRETKQVSIDPFIFAKQEILSDYVSNLAFATFQQIVEINKPFHITLLGLSFGKLENPANNNSINAFFKKCKSGPISPTFPSNSMACSSDVKIQRSDIGLKDICNDFRRGITLKDESDNLSCSNSFINKTKLPVGIDRSVFDSLPIDIQKEILNNYLCQSTGDINSPPSAMCATFSPNHRSRLKQTKLSDFFLKK